MTVAFVRLHPMLAGASIGSGFRFELRYGADLIQTFGAGRLYLQDADLSLTIPEIGPFGLRVAATGARFDAGQFIADSFWSAGARGQLTMRALPNPARGSDLRARSPPVRRCHRASASRRSQPIGAAGGGLVAVGGARSEPWTASTCHCAPTSSIRPRRRGQLRRFRGGIGIAYIPVATVTTSASSWAGTQSTDGVETDRQFGGALAVSVRAGAAFDVVARYDVLLNRAVSASRRTTRGRS